MKKAFLSSAALLAMLLCLGIAAATGGSAGDPLISLSYLQDTFLPQAETAVDGRLDAADETLRGEMQTRLDAMTSAAMAAAGQNFAPIAQETTLNEGDVLSGAAGLSAVPFAGDVTLSVTAGTVIDASTGKEVPSGTVLSPYHRYIVAENSVANFTAGAPTAIVSYQGNYSISRSPYSPDYHGIALALRSLGLFRGTGSGIGESFDLHLAPTRAEALVMFIRILGEEDDALACTFAHPFTDVPDWLDRYAAWAYEKGYANGVGNNMFGSQQKITIVEFQEFVLRALGYSIAGVDDYLTSMERAVACGALTDVEYIILKNCDFRRAHVAYLCYYNLDTVVAGNYLTLGQLLQQQGMFNYMQLEQAKTFVNSTRLH